MAGVTGGRGYKAPEYRRKGASWSPAEESGIKWRCRAGRWLAVPRGPRIISTCKVAGKAARVALLCCCDGVPRVRVQLVTSRPQCPPQVTVSAGPSRRLPQLSESAVLQVRQDIRGLGPQDTPTLLRSTRRDLRRELMAVHLQVSKGRA